MIASNVAPGDEVTVYLGALQRLQIHSVQVPLVSTFNVLMGGSRYRFHLLDEGQTWARGWDTEDARALEATVLLQAERRMNTPVVGDEITIVLASRCYRGRVAEVSGGPYIFGNRATKLSVSLANDTYTGTYWFGIHEERSVVVPRVGRRHRGCFPASTERCWLTRSWATASCWCSRERTFPSCWRALLVLACGPSTPSLDGSRAMTRV